MPTSQACTLWRAAQDAPSKKRSRSVSPFFILSCTLLSLAFSSEFSISRFLFSIYILLVYFTAVSTSLRPAFGPSLSCLITATFSLNPLWASFNSCLSLFTSWSWRAWVYGFFYERALLRLSISRVIWLWSRPNYFFSLARQILSKSVRRVFIIAFEILLAHLLRKSWATLYASSGIQSSFSRSAGFISDCVAGAFGSINLTLPESSAT